MRTDSNPDIIFLSYGTPKKQEEFIKAVQERGRGIREIRFFAVEQPLGETYNDDINFFKHFIMCDYWQDRQLSLTDNLFFPMIVKKMGYKPVKLTDRWKNDNRHPLLFSLVCPIAVQDQMGTCTTDEEKNNMKRLTTFSSDNYKEKIEGVSDE